MTFGWVVLGAAVYATAARALNHLRAFPWGTLLVNLVGALALGIVTAAVHGTPSGPQVGVVAFCGAFTTSFACALESVELGWFRGVVYSVVTVAAGLLVAAAGWVVGGG